MTLKLFIGNLCALVSLGTFAAGIISSIYEKPLEMSILWAAWFVSTAVYPLLDLPSSLDHPSLKPMIDIPLKTIVIQHPDETLSINTSRGPFGPSPNPRSRSPETGREQSPVPASQPCSDT